MNHPLDSVYSATHILRNLIVHGTFAGPTQADDRKKVIVFLVILASATFFLAAFIGGTPKEARTIQAAEEKCWDHYYK